MSRYGAEFDRQSQREMLIIGGVALLAWYVLKRVGDATGAGVDAVATGIARLWTSLTASPPIQVLGNVVFPDGARVAISSLTIKTDRATGAVYTMRGGQVYQLQPHNAQGDWPAVRVS